MNLLNRFTVSPLFSFNIIQPWLILLAALVTVFSINQINSAVFWFVCALYTLYLVIWSYRSAVLKHPHSLINFLLDLSFYTYVLSLHGGASSSATFVLFIPIISAALQLNRSRSWFITFTSISLYSFLMWQGVDEHFHHLGNHFIEHLFGMWLTFMSSALLMTWFITQQKLAINRQAKMISQLTDKQLKAEQILAVATTAANAAHSIGTPLSSANLLIEELKQNQQTNQTDASNLVITELSEQMSRCSQAVHQMTHQARNTLPDNQKWTHAIEFIQQTVRYWWVSFNEVEYQLNTDQLADKSVMILADFNLQMSLSNILQNAAQASLNNQQSTIQISLKLTDNWLEIDIDDQGTGIDETLKDQLGQSAILNSQQGLGIGLMLANTTIENLGGQLCLLNKMNNQGTRSQIKLPYRYPTKT